MSTTHKELSDLDIKGPQYFVHDDDCQENIKKQKVEDDTHFQEQFSEWLSSVDVDWSRTTLGPMEGWPALWKSYVCLMTSIKTPIALYWTSDLIAMFNESYLTIAGPHWKTKVGQSFQKAWSDYPDMIVLFHNVFKTGISITLEKQLFFIDIEGSRETRETYWNVTVHPIYNASGAIEGVLCQSLEFTDEIITDRRIRMLSELSKNTAAVNDEGEFWTKFMEPLDSNQ